MGLTINRLVLTNVWAAQGPEVAKAARKARIDKMHELRDQHGMSREASIDAAWEWMRDWKYVPPPEKKAGGGRNGQAGVGIHASEYVDVDALLERPDQLPDLTRDTLWAYENLLNRRVKPEDAPSLGAWSLLIWARQYRNRFFEQLLPKAMSAKGDVGEEGRIKEELQRIEEVRERLMRYREP
jgi:hypothetical protein